jgi:hypothetical protein
MTKTLMTRHNGEDSCATTNINSYQLDMYNNQLEMTLCMLNMPHMNASSTLT